MPSQGACTGWDRHGSDGTSLLHTRHVRTGTHGTGSACTCFKFHEPGLVALRRSAERQRVRHAIRRVSCRKTQPERGHAPAAPTCVSDASAVALRAGCLRARRGGNHRRPKSRTESASFTHAMLHAHRPLESGPRAARLTQCAGSHPKHERCSMVSICPRQHDCSPEPRYVHGSQHGRCSTGARAS